ncbi:F-box/LRR-repeat/kelch-repeat protein At2g27520-like [Brachypodium distachyon]|uniref:F-box/LRR-repeat/kelch-repeat protein At2g27520-like n=1 Tax=Brachypodium distachyon TaxID=15368 RepID=UPI000D0E0EDD|nr:F-box/LRR-repeat/kelch-repeat protein At2g27520-like [Brachypodium distachyon]|eukprot:XP_024315727.1 F-box/LRR-repeat/kelch-repeat protein At2g27520-like [Brachypodium distachyon]
MASSKLIPASSSSGDLPPDVLYEILLRVPAKDLCRLRAVCQAWRALTSNPLFAAAHKSCHKALLLALAYNNSNGNGVDIMDLSGNVLKRIPSTEPEITPVDNSGNAVVHTSDTENGTRVLPTHLDLVIFTREFSSVGLRVLNPAAGATLTLPTSLSEQLARRPRMQHFSEVESRAFGRVSSTGEYKVLRITRRYYERGRQLCEVITVDGMNHGSWRVKQSPHTLLVLVKI